MTRLNIILDDSLARELRERFPARTRSRFIAAAVEEKLRRIRLEEALEQSAGAWQDRESDPTEEVRIMRAGWSER